LNLQNYTKYKYKLITGVGNSQLEYNGNEPRHWWWY
jgi:hypothetical protein